MKKSTSIDSWYCDQCGDAVPTGIADVFFDGAPNPNLTDKVGNPIQFLSKGHKARWMKERGVIEVGDLVHGARYSPLSDSSQKQDRAKIRAEVRQAVQKAKDTLRHKYI